MSDQSIGGVVARRSMPILALILSAFLSKPVLASSCTFNDSGIVNVPGEIRVPATLPIGAVIATGQAEVNISCQVSNPNVLVALYFSRLRRCGDSYTWTDTQGRELAGLEMSGGGAQACNEVDINVGIQPGAFSETFQTQYPGVGIRMKMIVKNTQNFFIRRKEGPMWFETGAGGRRNGSNEMMTYPCRDYLQNPWQANQFYDQCQDPVNNIAAANWQAGQKAKLATQYVFQGQMLVELVKIRSLVWTGNPFVASGWKWSRGATLDGPSPSNQIASPYQNFLDHVFQVGLAGGKNPQPAYPVRVYGAFDKEPVGGGIDNNSQGQIYGTKAYRLATRIVDTAACDVVGSKNITVNMGQTATTTLDNNSTPEIPFQITLNCPAGARAQLAFTDSSNPSNQTDKLGLSANSEATGLALQLRSNGNVIRFAPETAISANAVPVDNAGVGGVVTVPLTAQAVKIGTVKPGKYTAQSTVTISYQ